MKQLVIALSILITAPAFANADSDFAKIDANGDGQVTIDELRASGINWTDEAFNTADSDGGGALSEAEFDNHYGEPK
ncbi:MAG: hypothetical protein ACR2O0_00830 [Rhizobiaceae bacterium]